MKKTPLFALLNCAILLVTRTAWAQAYDAESELLLNHYAGSVAVTDLDGDGSITDMDFSLWAIERVFARSVIDLNCDGQLNQLDAVLAVARELAGLTADFDDSEMVDGTDLDLVLDQVGASGVGAADGDLNGDDNVDAVDVAEAVSKWGNEPTLNPIDVAVSLVSPLIDLAGSNLPETLPSTPGCPAPELCGSATCKAKCKNADTGVQWTYRLFMVGFCGSQFEANQCCTAAAAVACSCSPDGFEFGCWLTAQGTYIACLLEVPG